MSNLKKDVVKFAFLNISNEAKIDPSENGYKLM
jgi:hypothetical protein